MPLKCGKPAGGQKALQRRSLRCLPSTSSAKEEFREVDYLTQLQINDSLLFFDLFLDSLALCSLSGQNLRWINKLKMFNAAG